MGKRVDITAGPFDPGGQPVIESENKVLLGVFAWNLAGGTSITKAVLLDPERRRDYWAWPQATHLMREADRIGCEFEVPFGRWLGHDGVTGFNEQAPGLSDRLGRVGAHHVQDAHLVDVPHRLRLPSLTIREVGSLD